MNFRQSIFLLFASLFFCLSLPASAEDAAEQTTTEAEGAAEQTTTEAEGAAEQTTTEAEQMTTVNINTADAETLAKHLKGVGEKRAAAIIAHRETNGKFYSAEELMSVEGIGERTLKINAERIVVE